MIKLVSKFATKAVKPYTIILSKQSTKTMGPTVRVRQGELRGAACPLPPSGGAHYFSFKGIPYAHPPLGKHRFKGDLRADDVDTLAAILSDAHFVYNCHRLGRVASARTPVFLYRFDCDTRLNAMKRLLGFAAARGACHADELFYLFNNAANQAEYEESEKLRALVYNITKLWTDFAKTGEPIPEGLEQKRWPALTAACARGPYVISHNVPNADVSANVDADADCHRVRFWNKLYKDAGLPFIANCTL